MERPNTVSGLEAKRKELADLHAKLMAEAKSVQSDIGHVDACIRLFDPDAKLRSIGLERYAPAHRAPKGHLRRFILNMFREADEPLTSRQIAAAWVRECGIDASRENVTLMRKRVGVSLQAVRKDSLIEEAGYEGECKLWALKKGGQ